MFAIIFLLLVSCHALFMEPLIGLADNGDFYRVIISNDLIHEIEWTEEDFFGYFTTTYDRLQHYNESGSETYTSQNFIIDMAMILDNMFNRNTKFDIRFLALICLLVLTIGIYWIVEIVQGMTDNKKIQYFLAFITVIIFGDIGYISYFNSFFGEAVAYPFYILSIAAILKFAREGMKIRYLVIFVVANIIFFGSKNQLALNGILGLLLLLILAFIIKDIRKKALSIVLAFILLITSVTMYVAIDDGIHLINKYHMMTRGVMIFEPQIEEVIEKVGIPHKFVHLTETTYYDGTPVIDPEDQLLLDEFYSQFSLMSVTKYYLTNPKALKKMMHFAWKSSFTIRPEVIGNYTRDSGKEFGARTNFFTFWSSFKEHHLPHKEGFVYLLLSIYLIFAINRILKARQEDDKTAAYCFELVIIYIILTAFSQVFVAFIGAGDADLKKHLFMSTVCLDFLIYFNFIYAISLLFKEDKVLQPNF